LPSAQKVNTDILDAIKATFKSKSITIIVEEDEDNYEITAEMKGFWMKTWRKTRKHTLLQFYLKFRSQIFSTHHKKLPLILVFRFRLKLQEIQGNVRQGR